jgi:hypothetical protein
LAEETPDGQGRRPDVVVGLREADALFIAGLLDVLLGEQASQRGNFVLAEGAKDRAKGGPLGIVGIRRKQRGLP